MANKKDEHGNEHKDEVDFGSGGEGDDITDVTYGKVANTKATVKRAMDNKSAKATVADHGGPAKDYDDETFTNTNSMPTPGNL